MEIYSMTGFGAAAITNENLAVRVEFRTVNNRGSKLNIRSRPSLNIYEKNLRELIASRLQRGSIEVNIEVTRHLNATQGAMIETLAGGVVATLRNVAQKLNLGGTLTINDLLNIPELFTEVLHEPLNASEWEILATVAETALQQLCTMRAVEGKTTATRLLEILTPIESFCQLARERTPLVVEKQREKLRQRIEEIGNVRDVDHQSLEREIVFFADRVDINEELDRLTSHLEQFRTTINHGGEIGKRLEFLAQEFLREVNTTASKANDLTITSAAVGAKTAIEKIKEQAANLE